MTAEQSAVRLFCLPYAGGGASVYRKWCGRLGDEIRVCPVQLAGREEKRKLMHCGTMERQCTDVADAIMQNTGFSEKIVLFGHSMGAKIAYEVAKLLECRGILLCGVIVSGSPAPDIPETADTAGMTDSELGSYLHSLGGIPEEVLQDESLLALLLPLFRADFTMMRGYCDRTGTKLHCPVYALGGTDDPEASCADVLRWQNYTAGRFGSRFLPGGHFYLFEHEAEMQMLLQEIICGFLNESNHGEDNS